MSEKRYPLVEVMVGEERTITREMTDEEKVLFDFCDGEQWTPEQIAEMARRGPALITRK